MRRDDKIMLAMVAALVLVRRRIDWGAGWVWPVPPMRTKDGVRYVPVITSRFGEPRPGGAIHRGVDIFYPRRNREDRPEYRAGTSQGSKNFFAPTGTPILAAKDGLIWSAGKTPRGGTIVIDHGKPFATYYTHMTHVEFPDVVGGYVKGTKKRAPVKAGAVIGWMGFDPLDASKQNHLHFSVAFEGPPESAAIDPENAMRTWPVVPWEWSG
jgi:murein DD-endopeptidase MepM/ murein hydrolase activator NlpD